MLSAAVISGRCGQSRKNDRLLHELMWLTGRLTPDFKTIANFRKDNGKAIRNVCRQFVVLCQRLGSCFRTRSWQSTAVNSRPSTAATAISLRPSSSAEWKKSKRISADTWRHSMLPIGKNQIPLSPRPDGWKRKSPTQNSNEGASSDRNPAQLIVG